MKNIYIVLTLILAFVSCDTEVKSEKQTGQLKERILNL
jgi:hypothetical protein